MKNNTNSKTQGQPFSTQNIRSFCPSPGPWIIASGRWVVAANGQQIATLDNDDDWEDEQTSNANLIKAALDMLTALQGVVSVADRKTVEFDAATAAINKALGIEPNDGINSETSCQQP